MAEQPLCHAFPILCDATIVKSDYTFDYNQFDAEHHRKAGMIALDTKHHGRVYVICSCRVEQYTLHLAADKGSTDGGLLFLIENRGDLGRTHTVLFVLLVPETGCAMCKKVGERMLKCGRCWKEAMFPVRYCSRECQQLDFPRHKGCCGNAVTMSAPMAERAAGSNAYLELIDKWA